MPTINRDDPLTWPIGWRPPMVKTTKAQRAAIKRLYDRMISGDLTWPEITISYRAFRRSYVYPGHDCVMVPLWGMWIGIEPDGYTHS